MGKNILLLAQMCCVLTPIVVAYAFIVESLCEVISARVQLRK